MASTPDFDFKGSKTRSLRAGDILFYEGSTADEMYFLERGTITISKRVLNKSIKLGEVGEGEFISERAVLCEDLPRSATAEATTDCEIIVIDKKLCKKFNESIPPFVQSMVERMATRLYHTNEMIVKMARTQEMVRDLAMRMQMLENSMLQSMEHQGTI
jgi:CRP-like cAMP-binding protein